MLQLSPDHLPAPDPLVPGGHPRPRRRRARPDHRRRPLVGGPRRPAARRRRLPWIFDADVDAQGGAYATGVLVLISSASIAVTIAARKARQRGWFIAFAVISVVFLCTTVVNVVERPDGVKIGACFMAGITLISLLSRLLRAFELRVTSVTLDDMAERFVRDMASRKIRFIANEPDSRDKAEYRKKIEQIRADNDLPEQEDFVFLEVTVTDPSEFEAGLTVQGEVLHNRYRVLTLESSSVPNTLAALLLHIRDTTGVVPHIYFLWTEGNPFANFLRFFLFGQGEVAPVTREVLRGAEPDRARRPRVHTGYWPPALRIGSALDRATQVDRAA